MFHPTVVFDEPYWVFDFTKPRSTPWQNSFKYTIGRYDETRPGMYNAEIFGNVRNHHVGVDIGGPIGTPVHAFADGEIFMIDVNDEEGSYGPTLITKHQVALPQSVGSTETGEVETFWVLYGHLSADVLDSWSIGQTFAKGSVLAHIGNEDENGGWAPHVHVQMSRNKPRVCDLPGVVAIEHRNDALRDYPDPRLILGELY